MSTPERPELPAKPTLGDLQTDIAALIIERGWEKENVEDVFLLLVEEIGELAKEVRKHTGKHVDRTRVKQVTHEELEGEFADVLNYLLDLANHMNVDLERAYRNKQIEVATRKWS